MKNKEFRKYEQSFSLKTDTVFMLLSGNTLNKISIDHEKVCLPRKLPDKKYLLKIKFFDQVVTFLFLLGSVGLLSTYLLNTYFMKEPLKMQFFSDKILILLCVLTMAPRVLIFTLTPNLKKDIELLNELLKANPFHANCIDIITATLKDKTLVYKYGLCLHLVAHLLKSAEEGELNQCSVGEIQALFSPLLSLSLLGLGKDDTNTEEVVKEVKELFFKALTKNLPEAATEIAIALLSDSNQTDLGANLTVSTVLTTAELVLQC